MNSWIEVTTQYGQKRLQCMQTGNYVEGIVYIGDHITMGNEERPNSTLVICKGSSYGDAYIYLRETYQEIKDKMIQRPPEYTGPG